MDFGELLARVPTLPKRKALLILDLQNDFVQPGKLPVTLLSGFTGPFIDLLEAFRLTGGIILWVRTESPEHGSLDQEIYANGDSVIVHKDATYLEGDTLDPYDSEDEMLQQVIRGESSLAGNKPSATKMVELMRQPKDRQDSRGSLKNQSTSSRDLFLTVHGEDGPCCLPGSEGSNLAEFAKLLVHPQDGHVTKPSYSAFTGTNLSNLLQSRIVTELYLCGTFTNMAVHATAAHAASHGMKVFIVSNCLGYRNKSAHEEALSQMVDNMGAVTVSAWDCASQLTGINYHNTTSIRSSDIARTNLQQKSKLPELYPKRPSTTVKLSATSETKPSSSARAMEHSAAQNPTNAQTAQASERNPGPYPTKPQTLDLPIRTTENTTLVDNIMTKANDLLQRQNKDAAQREVHKMAAKNRPSTLKPGDTIGEGDSHIIYDALPGLDHNLFSTLKNEIYWQKMYHAQGEVPRLVCVQGHIDPDDGSMPVYRHPADQSLPLLHFTETVTAIRKWVEAEVGHPMNHVLIQLYRSGHDNISEHSDKTLDIMRGSNIVNVSIGAQRTMRLRTKRSAAAKDATGASTSSRTTQLIPMPHCSMFIMGYKTNKVWLHGINRDKRPNNERSEEELAYAGERISLTFRHIGTYLDSQNRIWGQGATEKDKTKAQPVVNGQPAATKALIDAFGFENQQVDFDWDVVYGKGFDVLHFQA